MHLISSSWKNVKRNCIANCFAQAGFAKISENDNEHNDNYVFLLNDYAFAEFNINFSKYTNCHLITFKIETLVISDLMFSSDDSDYDSPETLQTVPLFTDALHGQEL